MGGLDGDLGHLGAHAADSKVLFIKNLSQQPFFFFNSNDRNIIESKV